MTTYNISNITNSDNVFNIQDTVSGYTTNAGTITGLSIGDTSIATSGSANITASSLINIFFPVGSYYETSDSTFNPNTSWGGTWSLESEGKVHVSAGSNYIIEGTGGATTVSITPSGSLADTPLSEKQVPSHNHGSDVHGSDSVAAYMFYSRRYSTSTSNTATITQTAWASTGSEISQATGTGGRFVATATDSLAGYRDLVTFNNTHTHTSVGSGTGHNHTFTGTAKNTNRMQPYIAIYRWHRTA